MGAVRNIVNDELLRMSYADPKNIKNFLRNWGNLERLSLMGDRVATCILLDLKSATGIDLDKWDRNRKLPFMKCYRDGCLSELQYISIAFVLVLGYGVQDVAYIYGISHQRISDSINTGIKRIQKRLGAFSGGG
jgi:hypothetical protein